MQKLLILSIVVAAIGGGAATNTAQAKEPKRCVGMHQGINFYRAATHKWQTKLNYPITKSSKSPIRGCAYAAWVAKLWKKRAMTWRERYEDRLNLLSKLNNDPRAAIRYVFGVHANDAISVASCETGGTFDVNASNGQYLGLFQMGSSERARFGHGSTALEQARAAYAYFSISGWSPWQCKPGGGLRW